MEFERGRKAVNRQVLARVEDPLPATNSLPRKIADQIQRNALPDMAGFGRAILGMQAPHTDIHAGGEMLRVSPTRTLPEKRCR